MRLAAALVLLAPLACAPRATRDVSAVAGEPFTFVSRLGDGQADFVGNAVALDAAGDALVAGATDGVAPGQRSLGGWDALAVKFAPDGALRWVRQLGSAADDQARAVAAAPDGDVLVSGRLGDSPFAARLDPAGNVRWQRRLAEAGPGADAIAVDARGEATTGVGSRVLHLDDKGEVIWTTLFFEGEAAASCVASDAAGNVAVAGARPVYAGLRERGRTLAVARLGADGGTLWRLGLGEDELRGAVWLEPRGVAIDPASGDVVVAGRSLRQEGALPDGFVVRVSAEGLVRWAMLLPRPGLPVSALAVGERGNIHVAGELSRPGPGAASLGLFVAAYDAAGTFGSMLEYATGQLNEARGIAVGRDGVFVAGAMAAPLGPGPRERRSVLALIKL